MKAQVYRHLSDAMAPAIQDTDRLTQESLEHPDAAEGAESLLEKRAPRFQRWPGAKS